MPERARQDCCEVGKILFGSGKVKGPRNEAQSYLRRDDDKKQLTGSVWLLKECVKGRDSKAVQGPWAPLQAPLTKWSQNKVSRKLFNEDALKGRNSVAHAAVNKVAQLERKVLLQSRDYLVREVDLKGC